MTTPVTLAVAPAVRTGATSDSGGTDSAAPFASALDGALGAGRSEVGDPGAQGGGDPAADQEETPAADPGTGTPAEPAPAAPGSVVAAVWALLPGAAKVAAAHDGTAGGRTLPGVGAPVAAGHGAGAPGLAVAGERAQANGTAHGLLGTQPGKTADGAPAAAAPAGSSAAPSAPPAMAAAAAALGAAGIEAVQVVTGPAAAAEDLVLAAPGTPPAVPAGEGAGAPDKGSTPALPTLPLASPDAAPDGTADTGSRSGTDGGEDGSARTDGVPTAASAGPPAPTAPAGRPEPATGAAVATPVSGQIARQVAVLRGGPDGTHTMTVVLTPETLGPVEVSVTVSQGIVELTLRGAHEHGRAALADALPHLRRDLEAAGLTCSRLDVDRGTSWSPSSHPGRPGEQGPGGHGPGGRGHQQDRSDGGARPWHRSADTGEGRRTATRAASGLDVRV